MIADRVVVGDADAIADTIEVVGNNASADTIGADIITAEAIDDADSILLLIAAHSTL